MAARELGQEEMGELLAGQRVVRLAFASGGEVYVIPVGYAWVDGALWLTLSRGKKTEMAAVNPRVAFQVDDTADSGVVRWRSVTGEGLLRLIGDTAGREEILEAVRARFPELAAWGEAEAERMRAAESLAAARLEPIWMTGRSFDGAGGG
jgi:nitroimidazol reductase NimA-like FMN-containing flavoprotein (pyridoxamine 5'-phosphate oxidase superfamily)